MSIQKFSLENSNNFKKGILYILYICIIMVIFELLFFMIVINPKIYHEVEDNSQLRDLIFPPNVRDQYLRESGIDIATLDYLKERNFFNNYIKSTILLEDEETERANYESLIIMSLIGCILLTICLSFGSLNLSGDTWFYILLTIFMIVAFSGTLYLYGEQFLYTSNEELQYKIYRKIIDEVKPITV